MKVVWLLGTAVPVLALAVASLTSPPKKLVFNASASAPIGFYWLDTRPVEPGDFVLARVPEQVRNLVEQREYLPPDIPLIKRVAGLQGDEICRYGQEILINGVAIAVAQETDRLGRPLPDWLGCRILTEHQVFLLQDDPQSFDGRYFGPVERSLIIGRAVRLHFP